MKTISLFEAHNLLSECSAVIINNDALTYPSLSDLEDDDANEFLIVSWLSDDSCEYTIIAQEGNNQTVIVQNDGSLTLVDDQGETFSCKLLVPMKID